MRLLLAFSCPAPRSYALRSTDQFFWPAVTLKGIPESEMSSESTFSLMILEAWLLLIARRLHLGFHTFSFLNKIERTLKFQLQLGAFWKVQFVAAAGLHQVGGQRS